MENGSKTYHRQIGEVNGLPDRKVQALRVTKGSLIHSLCSGATPTTLTCYLICLELLYLTPAAALIQN
jgi:hypothetical protein